jgi:hypothetical protein
MNLQSITTYLLLGALAWVLMSLYTDESRFQRGADLGTIHGAAPDYAGPWWRGYHHAYLKGEGCRRARLQGVPREFGQSESQ